MAIQHAPLDPDWVSRGLADAGVPWALLCLDECASTNREALERARRDSRLAGSGLAVFAAWQSEGRGRRGARWRSPRDADLLFSVVLQPPFPAERWSRLTHAAALAVCESLEPEFSPAVKWPNDIYLGGAKVAGILVESAPSEGLAVVGIGLNVNSDPNWLGHDLAAPATSLQFAGGRPIDRSGLAVDVLSRLHRATELAAADFGSVLAQLEARSLLIGRAVSLTAPDGGRLAGVAQGFGAEGELVLEFGDGSRRPFASAHEVRLAQPPPPPPP